MMTSTQAFVSVEKRSVQWQDYTGFADLLAERIPTAFPLSLGQPGAYNHLSVLGAGVRDVAVMMNGRPIRSASLGATFLEQLPPEMAEQTEISVGSEAVIVANNASGAAINIQEVRHDTKNLYTRIWYQQFGDQITNADVDMSYNAAPNFNVSLGARTFSVNRTYNNTGNRLWNARAILRWNIASTASISFSYLLTQQRLALNGGLLPTTDGNVSIVNSQPFFYELQENTLRHDLTLTGSAFLTRDSALAVALSTYATWDGRALERASLQGNSTYAGAAVTASQPDATIAQATTTNVSIGTTGRIETRVSLFSALEASLLAGGTVAVHSIPASIYWSAQAREGLRPILTQGEVSAFGRLGFTVLKSIDVSGGARLTILGARTAVASGAKASLYLIRSTTTSVQLWADASQSFRLPSIAEDGSAASTTELLPESHLLGLAGLRFRSATSESMFSSDILAFGRLVTNPILYDTANFPYTFPGEQLTIGGTVIRSFTEGSLATVRASNGSQRTIWGVSANAEWHAKNVVLGGGLVLSGFANLTLSQTNGQDDRRFPLLYAGATMQYEYTFGRDVLRVGVRLRAATSFAGERFSPTLWTYIPSGDSQGLTGNGIDIVAGAEVFGSLFIRATFQNALGSTAFTVDGYPQYPTVLRLTVGATILGN